MTDVARQFIARYAHVNWALADQAIVSGTNFLTGVLVARYLGVEEFGRFTLLWMAVLFVNSIQDALISSPMMSIGPKQSAAETSAYYGAVVAQQAVFSFAALLLVFAGATLIFAVFSEWQMGDMAVPLVVTMFVCQFQGFFRRYFFSHGRVAIAFTNLRHRA
jgi:O-antigen/teichoic acid export membrane protein